MGRYQLAKFLGEGSNAQVYLAYDLKDQNKKVVVKQIKGQVTQNPKFRQFFTAEVKSMVQFNHPYAVRLLDAALDDPLGPILILEYIRVVTLEDVIVQKGRLDLPRICRLLGPLCHALHDAHKRGIIHRDLKPANLMVTDVGTPKESLKVMDFGFASFTAKPHIQLSEITGQGAVFAVGTPAYVSPEMVRGDAVDGRADLYAVGVMLYEMLTGRLPFDYETVDQIIAAHVKEKPPRFNKIGASNISPAIEAVVQIALSKYPTERHPTARELAEAFETASMIRFWEETAPVGYQIPEAPPDSVVSLVSHQHVAPASPVADKFTLHDQFEANLSERLAAAKFRGFAEDIGGLVLESEPGVIRMHLGAPKKVQSRSALINWINTLRSTPVEKGKEPIELRIEMQRIDSTRVQVQACFMPLPDYMPTSTTVWKQRCESVYDLLRQYLMAST